MKMLLTKAAAAVLAVSVMLTSLSFTVSGADISIVSSGGWYETAFAEWSGSDVTTVEYKETLADDSTYTQVDSQLIRDNRVDIPGLKGDTRYTLRLTASDGSSTSTTVTTMSYNRDGYAHFNYSSGVGAYNNDGTLKDDADVIYVTNENKNTVTYEGYTGIANILSNARRFSNPLAVRFIGTVDTQTRDADGSKDTDKANGVVAINGLTDRDMGDDSYFNMCDISRPTELTLEGIGTDALIEKWGFTIAGGTSVEVRNLGFSLYPEDAIGIQNSGDYSTHIWVHNNDFEKGYNAYDLTDEKDKGDGDGSTDIKYSEYVTVSDNYYHECHKTSLVGGGTSHQQDYITFARNYFDTTYERTPRVRNAHVHVYNNYYSGTTGYGIGASYNSRIFSEANYFENANVPITMGPVGSDRYGGTVKSYADIFVNCADTANPDSAKNGTSYVTATSRDEVMNISNPVSGGNAYDNFDTDSSIFYYNNYSIMTAAEAKDFAIEYVGRLNTDSGYNNGNTEEPTTEPTTKTSTETTTETTSETTTETVTETTTEPTTDEPVDILYGDADNSGIITSNDAATVLAKALNNAFITPLEQAHPNDALAYLDVTADGRITSNDAAYILSKTLDNSFVFPAEE